MGLVGSVEPSGWFGSAAGDSSGRAGAGVACVASTAVPIVVFDWRRSIPGSAFTPEAGALFCPQTDCFVASSGSGPQYGLRSPGYTER